MSNDLDKNKKVPNVPNLRFPEFIEKYNSKRFTDALMFLNSNTFSRDMMNYESGKFKNIHYGDILIKLPTLVDCDNILLPFVNDNIFISPKLNLLKTGDIVIADTAEDYTAGKAIEIKNKSSRVISGLHTISCRPNFEFYNGYLGYYLNSFTFRKNLLPLIQGIKVFSVSKYMYNFLFINYPSMMEQKKITNLLLNIDARIQTQNKIIDNLKSQIKSISSRVYKLFSKTSKLSELISFEKKTNHKSEEGLKEGRYPFYTNEENQKKFFNSYDFDGLFILSNTGGRANFKIANGKFAVMSDTLVIKFKTPLLARTYINFLQNNTEKISHDLFAGSGLKHLDKNAFLNMNVPLVDKDLSIINKLFETLDNKLINEKKYLSLLIIQKQYLLNNLFI